ncbi:hypothetical protein COLO4_22601 [Corchorus olitorius]|uniref:Uncharacterized protein n=1 Tax=Corchorus olitorius TaxID=93759 RepID=A0A1R3IL73_9ROSI|nr:hypothetical protein COLO4_22601 [Corchorus olitorius]
MAQCVSGGRFCYVTFDQDVKAQAKTIGAES